MQTGFRRFADGFHIIVFTSNPKIEFPDYMTVKQEHHIILERDDVRQFEALVPLERGVDFWKWCQAVPDVAIKLDTQQEFHCPSCLTRKKQSPFSPPKSVHDGWKEVVARCDICGAFYLVLYKVGKRK